MQKVAASAAASLHSTCEEQDAQKQYAELPQTFYKAAGGARFQVAASAGSSLHTSVGVVGGRKKACAKMMVRSSWRCPCHYEEWTAWVVVGNRLICLKE